MTIEFREGDIVERNNGVKFELNDVNPDYGKAGHEDEYFAEGQGPYGTEIVDRPEDITLVLKAADAAERTVPTAQQIVAGLNLVGDGWGGTVDVDETEPDSDGAVICYGDTADGLRVAFVVTVSHVQETDF